MSLEIKDKEDLEVYQLLLTKKQDEHKIIEKSLISLRDKQNKTVNKAQNYKIQIEQLVEDRKAIFDLYSRDYRYFNLSLNLENQIKDKEKQIQLELCKIEREIDQVEKKFNNSKAGIKNINQLIKNFHFSLNYLVELKNQEVFVDKKIREQYFYGRTNSI